MYKDPDILFGSLFFCTKKCKKMYFNATYENTIKGGQILAATNSTANLGLNHWEPNDYVLREDFNSDNLKIDTALANMMQMVTGSYTGTGNYGPSNPNTLTFDFEPKLIIITSTKDTDVGIGHSMIPWKGKFMPVFTYVSGTWEYQVNGIYSSQVTWSNDGKTVSWYNDTSAWTEAQMNMTNTVYYYVAIG